MWLFTKHGFYSAVAARRGRKIDPTRVCVRARLHEHLVSLLDAHGDLLGRPRVTSSPDTDYRFRIVVRAGDWADVCRLLAYDIDYDNFKAACPDPAYHAWLNRVWAVGADVQDKAGR